MTRTIDWLPTQIKAFRDKQDVYFALVVANKVAWGIPDAAIAPLLVLQTEFVGLYNIIKDREKRTAAQVADFHGCHQRYAKAWRLFHKEWVAFNPAISKQDMVILVGKNYTHKHSPHPAIDDIPLVGLRAKGGGDIEFRCRPTKDTKKESMHPAANFVEFRFAILEVGDIPPADAEDYPKKDFSSRAKFTLKLSTRFTGKRFFTIVRWVNIHRPRQEGHWTEPMSVVIA
ncbi:MAG: hypothetical protein AAB038_01845 [Planctomycetota bacterium]